MLTQEQQRRAKTIKRMVTFWYWVIATIVAAGFAAAIMGVYSGEWRWLLISVPGYLLLRAAMKHS